eukprot:5740063-Pleurochrysis_carterae.AAC.4
MRFCINSKGKCMLNACVHSLCALLDALPACAARWESMDNWLFAFAVNSSTVANDPVWSRN